MRSSVTDWRLSEHAWGWPLRRQAVLAISLAAACVSVVAAVEIAPGVTYTEYSFSIPSNPNPPYNEKVYVVAVDRLRSEYKLKVGWPGQHRKFTIKQPTSVIAAGYHQPPGQEVLAATNASYFGEPPDIVGAPVASDGQIVQRPDSNNDTLMFGPSRVPVIQSAIANAAGTLTFANGSTIALDQYNVPVAIHKITALTPGYDTSTRSTFEGVEVILQNVSYPMRSEKEVSGIVSAIRTGPMDSLNNAIPVGGMVLNARGIPAGTVLSNTQVGDRLRMRFATGAADMNNADMAVTGIGWIIHNGLKQNGTNGQPNNWANRSAGSPYSRDPMTVLAFNNTHFFMVVCDGRLCNGIVGMTFDEMADFLTGTLGALDAISLDGGGSSTMVVGGTVKNLPADSCGTERAVADAVLLVKQSTATVFPLTDPFGPAGRLSGWDDKFAYAGVIPFAPTSPGGDGYALRVADPAGGVDTVRRGDFGDTDYTVQSDVYCEYRPGDAGDGFERYGLFARDSGTGAFGLSTYGGGNCYAMTCDSNDGRVRAGKYVNGTLSDFLPAPMYLAASGWHRFTIECKGTRIRYRLDGISIASVTDSTYARGFFGVGYHEFFTTNANIHGTRVDNFHVYAGGTIPGDLDDDTDVDLEDFGRFQACISGPDVAQTDPNCAAARIDGDTDVDQDDFLLLRRCLSGEDLPADPACTVP